MGFQKIIKSNKQNSSYRLNTHLNLRAYTWVRSIFTTNSGFISYREKKSICSFCYDNPYTGILAILVGNMLCCFAYFCYCWHYYCRHNTNLAFRLYRDSVVKYTIESASGPNCFYEEHGICYYMKSMAYKESRSWLDTHTHDWRVKSFWDNYYMHTVSAQCCCLGNYVATLQVWPMENTVQFLLDHYKYAHT